MSRRSKDPEVKIEGLRHLTKALKAAQGGAKGSLTDALKDANKEAAEAVAKTARGEVPVVSGKLRDSIRAAGTLRAGIVRAGKAKVPYAGPIHFGWPSRHIIPNPFLYDALDKRKSDVIEIFVDRVEKVIESFDNPSGRD